VEAAEGLEYLHAQKVVHGDVKDVSRSIVFSKPLSPPCAFQHNILIDDELHIRLCDFGLALVGDATQGRMTTTAHGFGSCNWMSPERIMAERHRRSTADDVYGFGCLGYYVSTLLETIRSAVLMGVRRCLRGTHPFTI
jgi:serine/threonine protein kinase